MTSSPGCRAAGRDSRTIEAKKAKGGLPETMHETFSAFANGAGGLILLGVDERRGFAVTGIDEPTKMLDRLVSLGAAMEPVLRPKLEALTLEGRTIVVAQIDPVPRDQRPCHRADSPPWSSSFLRVADGDQRLSSYEVQLLLENQTQPQHDRRVLLGSTIDELDGTAVAAFVRRLREQRPVLSAHSDAEILRLLNVVVPGPKDQRPAVTLTGLLAFGVYPQQRVPQLNVTLVVYPDLVAGAERPAR